MKNKNGFTLIELIVSISLVLLLFTLVVPGVTKLVRNSKKKQCENIKEIFYSAADLYVTDRKSSYSGDKISLETLYNTNYIDEKYEIEVNNSNITNGIWSVTGSPLNIITTRHEPYAGSEYGYYTYTIETDICD